MHREGEEVHLNEEEASGATRPRVSRWILGISLLLIVVAMSVVWISGALG